MSAKLGEVFNPAMTSFLYFSERGPSILIKLCQNSESQARTREFLIFSIEKSKAFMKQDPFLLISTRTTVTTRIEEDNRTLEDLPMSKEN